jgi:hypothetical protein
MIVEEDRWASHLQSIGVSCWVEHWNIGHLKVNVVMLDEV